MRLANIYSCSAYKTSQCDSLLRKNEAYSLRQTHAERTHTPLRREMATLLDTMFDNLAQSCEGKLTHMKS